MVKAASSGVLILCMSSPWLRAGGLLDPGDPIDAVVVAVVPGGGEANQRFYGPRVDIDSNVPGGVIKIVGEPQTSGGLLLAIPGEDTDSVVAALQAAGFGAARHVGLVIPRDEAAVVVR